MVGFEREPRCSRPTPLGGPYASERSTTGGLQLSFRRALAASTANAADCPFVGILEDSKRVDDPDPDPGAGENVGVRNRLNV